MSELYMCMHARTLEPVVQENIKIHIPIEKLERHGHMSIYTEPHGLHIPHSFQLPEVTLLAAKQNFSNILVGCTLQFN
jgi:hypothetical protein